MDVEQILEKLNDLSTVENMSIAGREAVIAAIDYIEETEKTRVSLRAGMKALDMLDVAEKGERPCLTQRIKVIGEDIKELLRRGED